MAGAPKIIISVNAEDVSRLIELADSLKSISDELREITRNADVYQVPRVSSGDGDAKRAFSRYDADSLQA